MNTTPVAHGVDCRDTGAGDDACAAANRAEISTSWLTAAFKADPKVGHKLPTAQFFEGGGDLTEAGLGGNCFNTFIGDTRSSTSLTATLFDFARGQLGRCVSGISSAQTWLPNDSATANVTGAATWSGSIVFTLYEGALNCTGTVVYGPQSLPVDETTPTATTTNGTFKATASQDYSWKVVFTPNAETAAKGVQPADHCESTDLTITN